MSTYPHYCSTLESAEQSAVEIASECGLQRQQEAGQPPYLCNNRQLIFHNDIYEVVINLFLDNWYREQPCYSFSGALVSKKTGDRTKVPLNGGWRKCPDYFASDLRLCIKLQEEKDSGKSKKRYGPQPSVEYEGEITDWFEKGYGFLTVRCPVRRWDGFDFIETEAPHSIFIHISEIPMPYRTRIGKGTKLSCEVCSGKKGWYANKVCILSLPVSPDVIPDGTQPEPEGEEDIPF